MSGIHRSLMGGRSVALGADTLQALFGAIDLVGQGQATASQARAALEQHLASKNALMVSDEPPTKARRFPLGFPTTTITAVAVTGTVSTQPQILFRGERLIIPSDIAGGLLITSITVGKDAQVAAQNPLPARTYTEQGQGIDMHIDTADVSQFIQLGLQNVTAHDIVVNCQFIGASAQ